MLHCCCCTILIFHIGRFNIILMQDDLSRVDDDVLMNTLYKKFTWRAIIIIYNTQFQKHRINSLCTKCLTKGLPIVQASRPSLCYNFATVVMQ